jgi:hypothetical protein
VNDVGMRLGRPLRLRSALGVVGFAVLGLSWLACGGSAPDDPQPSTGGRSASASTSCIPAEARKCPCVGGAQTGSQVCDASGNRYGACTGCPALAAVAGTGAGGTSGQPSLAGRSGAGGSTAGAGGAGGKGFDEATDNAALMDVGTAAPGIWCGAGLPALCDLETEKCCDRTLQPDSCIASAAKCDCEFPDCQVMEAHCDGPEDCQNGQVCCGTLVSDQDVGSRYTTFACAAQCSLQQNRPEACHTSEDTCPSGLECANSQILANVQICIDPQTISQEP